MPAGKIKSPAVRLSAILGKGKSGAVKPKGIKPVAKIKMGTRRKRK